MTLKVSFCQHHGINLSSYKTMIFWKMCVCYIFFHCDKSDHFTLPFQFTHIDATIFIATAYSCIDSSILNEFEKSWESSQVIISVGDFGNFILQIK